MPMARVLSTCRPLQSARADADPDSDMDVLVVLDEPRTPEVRDAVSDCAWEAGFDAGVVVVPIVVSLDHWKNGPERSSLLAMAVREEGVRVSSSSRNGSVYPERSYILNEVQGRRHCPAVLGTR